MAAEIESVIEQHGLKVNYPTVPIQTYIEHHAVHYPDAIAIQFQTDQLTYQSLNERANQLANYLKSLGVNPGDRVAVCLQPALEIGVCLIGILKIGGVYVPLDPTHPQERLTVILQETQAKVTLTQSQFQSVLPAVDHPTVYLDLDWGEIESWPTQSPAINLDLDQTAYIIYTSGTTGQPKGVMTSHRNLINYILATQEKFGFSRDDVMPAIARFTFSISLFELLSPLVAGGTLVVLERAHILDFKRMSQTLERLTMIHTVPSLMQKLLGYIQDNALESQRFQHIKYVMTGGDIVSPDLLETIKAIFAGASTYVLYGCSEVSSLCLSYPVPKDQPIARTLIGKPFNNVAVRLYDASQNPVPVGTAGEIYVSGSGVTSGYLNREALTQEKFVTIDGQRWYRTGDLGRFHEDGNLEFLGRTDFQINLRGIRMEPIEIESALRKAPGVKDAVAMAHELQNGEMVLVAYLVLQEPKTVRLDIIRDFLKTKLPDYMLPNQFLVLDEMPLNINQKVDRRALPIPDPEHFRNNQTLVLPKNRFEQETTALWETLLKAQPISVHDNFFELGGNSLLAVEMLHQLENRFATRLSLPMLLQAPTVRGLCEVIQGAAEREHSKHLDVQSLSAMSASLEEVSSFSDRALLPDSPSLAVKEELSTSTLLGHAVNKKLNQFIRKLNSIDRRILSDYPLSQHCKTLKALRLTQPFMLIPEEMRQSIVAIGQSYGQDVVALYQKAVLAFLIQSSLPVFQDKNLPLDIRDCYRSYFEYIFQDLDQQNSQFYDYANDLFVKDLNVCSLRMIPVGETLVEFAKISRRSFLGIRKHGSLLKQGSLNKVMQLFHFYLTKIKGEMTFYEFHLDIRRLKEFNPVGRQQFYLRIAEMLKLNPHIQGIYGISWLNDPHLAAVSPELLFLREIPEQSGAKVFKVAAFPEDITRATATSPTRKRLYEEGLYVPTSYALIWLRDDLIKWSESCEL